MYLSARLHQLTEPLCNILFYVLSAQKLSTAASRDILRARFSMIVDSWLFFIIA